MNPLLLILGAGLLLRLVFIGSEGFHNDLAAFESWTLTLRDNAPWNFYAKAGFADYPPGYFVVLWVLAKLYALVPGTASEAAHGWPLLRALVKAPAIAMDLVDAFVIYLIVRRYAAERVALFAAAALALNPAAIYVSSYWGQIDSVSWGLVLIAVWLVLRAGDEPSQTTSRLVLAWLAFAASVLIKPQGLTVGLIFLAYPFATADPEVRARRLAGTGAGIAASLALAGVVSLVFHPSGDVFGWLFDRYAFGSKVYAYTSVNAFNLYALRMPFWQSDATPISLFGAAVGSYWAWGIGLVVAASLLIAGRYLQRRDERALIEGAMLCALAFFVLATRMHERYVYGAFLLAIPLIAFGRAGIWSTIVLTVTMYLNLAYSFAYQAAVESHAAVNTADLWPAISHPAAFANVVLFFALGYLFLGGYESVAATAADGGAPARGSAWERLRAAGRNARGWFDPREGTVGMTRTDWLLCAGFVAVAFAVAIVSYAWPPEKYFDEVYFARSGAEYLRGVPQYEWTHPPFTKLVIALSITLFGGVPHGDTSWGWRFLNVLIGALEVGVVYAFAKRLTGMTVFAALAAVCMTFDGFHFTESRISTGEITIATLILILLYAFYRYWVAAQVRVERRAAGQFGIPFWTVLAAGIPVSAGFAWLANLQPAAHTTPIANAIDATTGPTAYSYAVAFGYAYLGVYLLARIVLPRFLPQTGTRVSYADGTVVEGRQTFAPEERASDPELRVEYLPDGTERYKTPVAAAEFKPSGELRVDGAPAASAASAKTWLAVMVIAAGFMISSKWNGFYDFGVIVIAVCAVYAQRFLTGRALYGNPRGFPIDVVFGVLLWGAATIYILTYVPTLLRATGHTLADIMALQQQMFWYHSHGVANATHPYSSVWWQWPIMQIPIVYYYHDFRTGAATANAAACCVAEIIAIPNPLVFLLGLVSVPFTGWLAWRERNKGYALLVLAYFVQWLPWTRAPRILWEYHFFPNFALIVLCDVVLIRYLLERVPAPRRLWYLGGYAAAVVLLFAYFYPVLAGVPVSYDAWHNRMWPDVLGIPNVSWILPHR